MMKFRSVLALAFSLALVASAHAQTSPGSSPWTIPKGGTGASTAANARTNLGLAIGTNVEAWNTNLDCLAALASNGVLERTGSGTCAVLTAPQLTAFLNVFTTTLNGLVPDPGSVTGKFLGDDGNWHTASGSGTVTSAQLTAGTGIGVATTSGANPCVTTCNLTVTNSGVVTVKKQVFTVSGTYTPSAGMLFAMIECQGPGGGSGGVNGATSVSTVAGGGSAGGYSRTLATAATVGASQTVTMGTVGAAGAAGNNAGGAGTATSVGALCVANGGLGGAGNGASPVGAQGGAPPATGTGDITAVGNGGGSALGNATTGGAVSGYGGGSYFGGGPSGTVQAGSGCTAGVAGKNYGAGASGAACNNTATATAGAAGGPPVVYITEYNSQ